MAYWAFPSADEVETLFERLVNDHIAPGLTRALQEKNGKVVNGGCGAVRGQVGGQTDGTVDKPTRPRIDVVELPEGYVIEADLPGVQKGAFLSPLADGRGRGADASEAEDISVDLHNNRLTISGQTKSSAEHDQGTVKVRTPTSPFGNAPSLNVTSGQVSERRFGHFSRTVSVPEGTPQDKVKASFDSGVLRVELAKPEARHAHKIDIA